MCSNNYRSGKKCQLIARSLTSISLFTEVLTSGDRLSLSKSGNSHLQPQFSILAVTLPPLLISEGKRLLSIKEIIEKSLIHPLQLDQLFPGCEYTSKLAHQSPSQHEHGRHVIN